MQTHTHSAVHAQRIHMALRK